MNKNRRSKFLFAYALCKERNIIAPKMIRNTFGKPFVKDHSEIWGLKNLKSIINLWQGFTW